MIAKSLINIFVLFLCLLSESGAFVSYPLDALTFLDSYAKSVGAAKETIKENVMRHAVPGADCLRPCETHERKVCHFKFQLEHYQVLGGACTICANKSIEACLNPQCVTADGFKRGMLAINRQLPGPAIQVCVNDIVVVDVSNHMDGTATSIHWHGMTQKNTPFSDGVPFITQCPIHHGNTFRYIYKANDVGTHFYHSHSGLQKSNGIYGPIIVRIPGEMKLHDHDRTEFIILVSDWMHEYAEQFFPELPNRLFLYRSVLINGRGVSFDDTTQLYSDSPVTVYHVQQNNRYRFRLINAASNVCQFIIKIENHNFTVISVDGASIEPVTVNTLHFTSGERFDFVVETDKEPRDYSIQAKGHGLCKGFQGVAVLRYGDEPAKTSADFIKVEKTVVAPPVLNEKTFNHPQLNITGFHITRAHGRIIDRRLTKMEPDEKFNIFFGTPQINETTLYNSVNTIKYMSFVSPKLNETLNNIGVINNISIAMPNFALLAEPERIHERMFCDANNKLEKPCLPDTKFCHCIHRIKVKLNSVVDLTLIDIQDGLTHPFHLHGFKFYVMEMGAFDMNVTNSAKIRNHGIPKNHNLNKDPVHRDTVLVPNKGYVRLRFRADNPGFWFAHCHFEWHLAIGMGFILQVGELEDMPKPSQYYAKCHDFLPNSMA